MVVLRMQLHLIDCWLDPCTFENSFDFEYVEV